MDELIKMLDSNLSYIGHTIKDDKLIISVESKNKEVKCTFCGEISTKVHSIYHKKFQDLPVMNIYFCYNLFYFNYSNTL